jgi:hypothetical protein
MSKVFLLLVLACTTTLPATVSAAATEGITITPATATLRLPAGTSSTSSRITLHNAYASPVTVVSDIGLSQTGNAQLANQDFVHVESPSLTIPAHAEAYQTITLRDSAQLSPGSTFAYLRFTQQQAKSKGVDIAATLQVPLILFKESGATAHIALQPLKIAKVQFALPKTLIGTFENRGNTVVIPRGLATITDARKSLISQSILNTASLGVVPSSSTKLAMEFQHLSAARYPGRYTLDISYGAGGGTDAQHLTAQFWYIAWWHIALTVVCGLSLYGFSKKYSRFFRTKSSKTSSSI